MRLLSRSLRLLTLAASLGAASAGCVISDGDGDSYDYNPPDPGNTQTTTTEKAPIDANATINVTAGDGVGVFIEYKNDGQWHVFTSCDTNEPTNPGVACGFDVFASALSNDVTLSDAQGENLADQDSIELQADGTVHLQTDTSTGLNGMTFQANPGATIEFDVYLDGQEDPHFIYWIGNKVLHQGAPSDPLDLTPNEAVTGGDAGTGGAGGGSGSDAGTGTGDDAGTGSDSGASPDAGTP